ncbi:MAG: hypothetical protein J6X61_06235 [Clostridia bacterium]|nr:hypothetical protein [Clostridia bacterium]
MKRFVALLLAGMTAVCLAGCSFGEQPGDPTAAASGTAAWSETFPAKESKEMDPMQACMVNNEMVSHLALMASEVSYNDVTYLKENIAYLRQYSAHTRSETAYMVHMEELATALYFLYSGNCEMDAVEAAIAACQAAYPTLETDIRGILLPLDADAARAAAVNLAAFANTQVH